MDAGYYTDSNKDFPSTYCWARATLAFAIPNFQNTVKRGTKQYYISVAGWFIHSKDISNK